MLNFLQGMFIEHDRVTIETGESRTKQSFRDETDINRIMAQWKRTGQIEHLAKSEPRYGDFNNSVDYQTAVNQVLEADEAFMALPAEIRDRFQNAPGQLLDFVGDPANQDEAVALGLVEAPRVPPDPALTPRPDPPGDPAPDPVGDPPPTG